MIKISTLVILVLISLPFFGQEESNIKKAKNSINFELFGNGVLYSVNYERLLKEYNNFNTAFRIGGSYLEKIAISIPIEYLFLIGKKSSHLEFGIGYTLIFEHTTERRYITGYPDRWEYIESEYYEIYHVFMPRLGYRYQKPTGGFLFKIALTPVLLAIHDGVSDVGFNLFGGISFGYSF